MFTIPKGTKDVLPRDSYKWQFVENAARETAKLFSAREIRTPVFEYTELFLRSIGEETDVVSKEMYTFNDKKGRSLTLKPEGTAPVARSYVENALEADSLPLKMFYFTPVFRYEKPQEGRLREHHQFGVEVYGSASYLMDAEVIALANTFLKKVGVKDLKLNLNSIGCPECRKKYNEALKAFLQKNVDNMCSNCRERFAKNPMRVLDCKEENCKAIVKGAPRIIDFLCDGCRAHMNGLESALKTYGIDYVINPDIVRGLDYYTKTVFEFVTTSLGSQGTVCGGGRYDNLVESVGGKSTPCVGFGIGLERLIMLLEKVGTEMINTNRPDIYIAPQAGDYALQCVDIVKTLRGGGICAETDFMGRSVKAQFKYADKTGARFVAVIGGNEIGSGAVEIKNMLDGTKETVRLDKITEYVRSKKQ